MYYLFMYLILILKIGRKKFAQHSPPRPRGRSAGMASQQPGTGTSGGLPVDRVPCKRLDEAGLFR